MWYCHLVIQNFNSTPSPTSHPLRFSSPPLPLPSLFSTLSSLLHPLLSSFKLSTLDLFHLLFHLRTLLPNSSRIPDWIPLQSSIRQPSHQTTAWTVASLFLRSACPCSVRCLDILFPHLCLISKCILSSLTRSSVLPLSTPAWSLPSNLFSVRVILLPLPGIASTLVWSVPDSFNILPPLLFFLLTLVTLTLFPHWFFYFVSSLLHHLITILILIIPTVSTWRFYSNRLHRRLRQKTVSCLLGFRSRFPV